MHRRHFLCSVFVAAVATPAAAEQFPIFATENNEVAYKYRQRVVAFKADYDPGTIVVDTKNRYLYFVQTGGKAIRYGVAVGREGFAWSGEAVVARKAKWPTWTPTVEALARSPYLQRFANGFPPGPRNPLGARALYLFDDNVDTQYRIHGTPFPFTIGQKVSTGCIRMLNTAVADLYERAPVGTKVVVLQDGALQ